MKKGRAHTMTHDYKRHGTTTLFAALNTLDGSVLATCMERHRHQEWLKFLRMIDRQTPARQTAPPYRRQVCHPQTSGGSALGDASQAHSFSLQARQQQLAQHGRTILPRPDRESAAARRLYQRRSSPRMHPRLCRRTNRQPKPFIWTAKANDILEKVKRAKANLNNSPSV
jgi:hypothetical protein